MDIKDLEADIEEAFLDSFPPKFNLTPREAQVTKRLYKAFLVGHWSALTDNKKKGLYKEVATDGGNGKISWWIHVARGLITIQDDLATAQPDKKLDYSKIDFSAINRAVANPK